MKKKNNIFYLVVLFFSFIICSDPKMNIENIGLKIEGSMLAGAIGDALGRVTEFIKTTSEIFKKYPYGVRSFDDFVLSDWLGLPEKFKKNNIAPYTDDTRMAKLVLIELIKSRKNNWDLNQTMEFLAKSFVNDMHDKKYGWSAGYRAPGNTVLKSTKRLEELITYPDQRNKKIIGWWRWIIQQFSYLFGHKAKKESLPWWDVGPLCAGGCGSVMRAHPFGLVFANDPDKAADWAAQHSKLTHGHPMALAACAALAMGVAYALQNKDAQEILDAMIAVAQKYDNETAQKMRQARKWAEEVKLKRKRFTDIFEALQNQEFRAFHNKVFTTFEGWAAHDAIAATVYIFA